jgi:acid phosphatase family membrane protein YuiD
MSGSQIQQLVAAGIQTVAGLTSSTLFVLALFIGFCVIVGFTKLKKTAGGGAVVIKSLDERISRRPATYLAPSAPHGPADQLRAPELLEAPARSNQT